jgi:hypothetical protein
VSAEAASGAAIISASAIKLDETRFFIGTPARGRPSGAGLFDSAR